MGVLACSRNGCENIMCDRLSSTHNYICNECFNELVDLGVDQCIYEFMDSRKGKHSVPDESAYDFFDREFTDIRTLE